MTWPAPRGLWDRRGKRAERSGSAPPHHLPCSTYACRRCWPLGQRGVVTLREKISQERNDRGRRSLSERCGPALHVAACRCRHAEPPGRVHPLRLLRRLHHEEIERLRDTGQAAQGVQQPRPRDLLLGLPLRRVEPGDEPLVVLAGAGTGAQLPPRSGHGPPAGSGGVDGRAEAGPG